MSLYSFDLSCPDLGAIEESWHECADEAEAEHHARELMTAIALRRRLEHRGDDLTVVYVHGDEPEDPLMLVARPGEAVWLSRPVR